MRIAIPQSQPRTSIYQGHTMYNRKSNAKGLTAQGLRLLLALGCMLGTLGCTTTAQTHLLLMGGGPEPKSNQISLEKNMLYFHRIIGRLGLSDAQRDVLFACGVSPAENDIQYLAVASEDPQVQTLIEALLGTSLSSSKAYRPHDIGAQNELTSTPQNITQWFDRQAKEIKPADRVLIYFTGHGSRGTKDNLQNTGLHLWSKQLMRMQEFTGELDKLDKNTPVVLVMVQCFAGGFANVIFNEGDPTKGITDYNRCGFYAAVHDRTAAGCTAHVNEADYQEYSSYFWAALSGENRMGQPVERPDYNNDGVTSYLEAHAYAMIQSDSSDLSMTTTDCLVRSIEVDAPEGQTGLLTKTSSYPELLAAADPIRRAILEGLSQRMELTGDDRPTKAADTLAEVDRELASLKQRQGKLLGELSSERKPLVEKLSDRWPALKERSKPQALQTVLEQSQPILEAVADEPSYASLKATLAKLQKLNEDMEMQLTRKAHAERFIYTCESVAKINTLQRFARPQYFKAYYDLLERELATPQR